MTTTRPAAVDDAEQLTKLMVESRDFMRRYEPDREPEFFTVEHQRKGIAANLAAYERGEMIPHVILDDDTIVVGRINLVTIVRGPFQSCSLGYWVGEQYNGRGHATRAVAAIKRVAFNEHGLHRIEASVLLDNLASQRVLERNGFARFGVAPTYLKIAGAWQDMAIYQVITDHPD